MSYIGDVALSQTFDTKFTTRQISGAPNTLAGSPVISNYIGNNTTQLTAGITLSVDFDSVAGLNNVRVVATGANGYAAQTDNQLVITTGTVNSVSVVGEVVAEYSIENRAALRPTTAGRTLDVSAGGEAGVDWANVGSPTTAVDLSGTTIKTTQKVDVDTIKTNPVANGGTVTFPTNATLASTTNITAGTITTATNLTNAPTVGDFTAAMKTSLNAATPAVTVSDKTGFSLTAAYDFAKGTVAMTEAYAANGVAPTPAQALFGIQQYLMDFSIAGTDYTVKKLDNSATAFIVTLNDATNPTAAART